MQHTATANKLLLWDNTGQQYLLKIHDTLYPLRNVPWGTALAIAIAIEEMQK